MNMQQPELSSREGTIIMSRGLDHPLVTAYLIRLDEVAATVPPGRRGELIADLRTHLDQALGTADLTETEVQAILDRLGQPEAIVAAELQAETPDGAPAGAEATRPTTAHSTGPVRSFPPGPPPVTSHTPGSPILVSAGSPWGPLEVIGVALIATSIFGSILGLPLTVIGLTCVWASGRWKVSDKVIATLFGLGGYLLAVLIIMAAHVFNAAPFAIDLLRSRFS
jgi:hypothetical protein